MDWIRLNNHWMHLFLIYEHIKHSQYQWAMVLVQEELHIIKFVYTLDLLCRCWVAKETIYHILGASDGAAVGEKLGAEVGLNETSRT